MPCQQEIDSLRTFIEERDGFTIIAHKSPDGDTLGSTLALLWLLRKLGKRAEAVCADPMPAIYMFLPLADEICLPKDVVGYENAISVDCADRSRLGTANDLFAAAKATYNIDHHRTNDAYAQHNAVNPSAAATGELIYHLLQSLAVSPEADFASCLYTALMTDTGNFAYSNTTGETMRIAADLLDAGADGYGLNLRIYRNTSFERLLLLRQAIGNIRLYEGGRVGITSLTKAEIADCGAQEDETEGVVDYIRDIQSVEIAVFIKQSAEDVWKISLRSKLQADVGTIAAKLGGGGHERAAGYTAHGRLESAWAEALGHAKEALL
ncbi:MAG: bifunctional oligoribonuclease/PAP phosphatase NrnA [Clostridia bacterium]|nr:bifunctional oligoribonuclease/PAP phosphatase NrnA [Clostridia bacterium]